MSNTETFVIETNDDRTKFLLRMHQVKSRFQKMGITRWTELFIDNYPEYNSLKQGTRLHNIWNLKTFDSEVLEKLEALCDQLEND